MGAMSDAALPTGTAPFIGDLPPRLGTRGTVVDGAFAATLDSLPTLLTHGALRASVVACLVDIVAGLTADTVAECWSFTSDLSVRIPATPAPARLHSHADVLRDGKRSSVFAVPLLAPDGTEWGLGLATFSRVQQRPGDPVKPIVDQATFDHDWAQVTPLDVPLLEAAGVRITDPRTGVVEIDLAPEVQNPAGALHGAIVALVAEVAAEALSSAALGTPQIVTGLDIRYLKQARSGPVRTRARFIGPPAAGIVAVELVDTGLDDALVTTVLARTEPAPTLA